MCCYCGPAVAAGWFVVLFSGNRRFERSWIEYAGRLLGIAWITLSLICAGRVEYRIFKEDLSARERLRDNNIIHNEHHPLTLYNAEATTLRQYGGIMMPAPVAPIPPVYLGQGVSVPPPALPPMLPGQGVMVPATIAPAEADGRNDDSVAPDAPE